MTLGFRDAALARKVGVVAVSAAILSLVRCSEASRSASNDSQGGRVASAAGGAEPTGGIASSTPGLRGTLLDEAGQVIGDSPVLACMSETCLFGSSDQDGNFEFEFDSGVDVAIKTPEALNVTPRRAALLIPVRVADAVVDLGEVHVPSLPEGVPISASSSEPRVCAAGDGLSLTIQASAVTPRLGDKLRDVAARRVPLDRVGPIPGLEGEELVAIYAIHPFAATSTVPIAAEAPAEVARGAVVWFRSISEIDGQLSERVPGIVDGSTVRTAPGAGIEELTWLVISRERAP